MLPYSIIMFFVAVPMLIISIAIYKGNTNLIHDYHQTKVKDKEAYGKAFGKAMIVIPIAMLLSGIVNLFGSAEVFVIIALSILALGLVVGIALIIVVQIKYNKGIF